MALPSETPDLDLKQPGDVVQLLALTISQLRRGQIEPRIANGVGYLGSIVLSAMDMGWKPTPASIEFVVVQPEGQIPTDPDWEALHSPRKS